MVCRPNLRPYRPRLYESKTDIHERLTLDSNLRIYQTLVLSVLTIRCRHLTMGLLTMS